MTPKPSTETRDFHAWFMELKTIAVQQFGFNNKAVETMHEDDWRDYFEDDYSPLDALQEDLSYDD